MGSSVCKYFPQVVAQRHVSVNTADNVVARFRNNGSDGVTDVGAFIFHARGNTSKANKSVGSTMRPMFQSVVTLTQLIKPVDNGDFHQIKKTAEKIKACHRQAGNKADRNSGNTIKPVISDSLPVMAL